jgi:hypothetical protein
MTSVLIAILSPLAWLILQAFVWSRWRGGWRIVASIPVLVGVGGCLYYSVIRDSNLGPLWFVVVAPFSVGFLLLLWGAHTIVMRGSR